jgi:prepilin signal peptidase PulO-like enzyme (type II secretory pathway)
MFWLRYFHAAAIAILLLAICLMMTNFIGLGAKEVYHIQKRKPDKVILTFISLVSVSITITLILAAKDILFLTKGIVSVFLVFNLALIDHDQGRIPIHFLGSALVVGIYFGLLEGGLNKILIGGVANLVIGWSVYGLGKQFIKRKYSESNSDQAFGFGDVYGAGVLGFLIGFPGGMWAFLLTLLLSLIGTAISAVIMRKKFISSKVRLGVCFFCALVCFILLDLISFSS